MATTKNKTRSELSEVLFLFTTREDDPITFSYEVECTTFKAVNLTLNFEGSENFAVEGSNGMKLTASIRPFSRVSMGKIYLVSDDKRASLKMGCEWTMADPSMEETAAYIQAHVLKMQPILKDAQTIPFPPSEIDPTDEKVHQICHNYGKKFIDKDFPPTITSLFKADTKLLPGEMSGMAVTKRSAIEWKRASDFMVGEYHVFEGGIEPGDIRQGALGDCWFLCAIAALTEFPKLVLDLIETEEINEHGVYRVKFCKNGWWQSVRVDDYFPCFPGAGPIYSRSNGNELWVMLLEKAFAKLCGSYEAVKSGWAYEGMMDMTGAPCKTIRLDDSTVIPKIENGQLWRDLLFYDNENYIMSASTPGEDTFTETGNRPGECLIRRARLHLQVLMLASESGIHR
jgi:calpain-15